ncbi:MAG: L-threonylcarbamoyladenylate synthase [candidate division Zixibacteria bacterium]|nr:L-threonylcarbamoyladenylate synthase [candidate division Zixibacteria bacterium]
MSIANISPILPDAPDPTVIDMAVEILRKGGIVVAPTETRYGLLACANDNRAIKCVYKVKDRSVDQPTAIFVDNVASMDVIGRMTPAARLLATRYLPGPLTLVVKAVIDRGAPLVVDGRIGLRVSPAPIVKKLLERTGFPLTATSANLSGRGDAGKVIEIAEMFGNNVDLYLDGGELFVPSSTVVDCTGDTVRVLRDGAIPKTEIMSVLRGV